MRCTTGNDFYVYTYASSLNGLVFYVGKGCEDRYLHHIKQARMKNTLSDGSIRILSRVSQEVQSVWKQGGKVIIRKPYKDVSDLEALSLERSLIVLYGFEQLVNYPYGREKKQARSLLESS